MTVRTRAIVGGLAVLAVVGVSVYVYVDAQPPGSGGVTGKFLATDDTGLGSRTLGEGRFLVVPGVIVQDVWPTQRKSDLGIYPDVSPSSADVNRAVQEFEAVVVEVQPNGRFRINVAAGPAVVCLIGKGGCVELSLPESGSVDAYYGVGGFDIG